MMIAATTAGHDIRLGVWFKRDAIIWGAMARSAGRIK